MRDIWGEAGLAALREHLPPDARRALCDEIVLPVAWYPETHFEACCNIVWRHLAREQNGRFFDFVHRSIDSGWTVVHRAVMRFATPQRLARRAPDLWRHDHSHGELLVDFRETSGTVRIKGYPYPRESIMHHGQMEALRHILSHARVRDVRAKRHDEAGTDFVATFEWT
ncbi:MAG TPA: hypothetical protein VF765_32725 [Polyangiaceae bacterium]